MTDQTTDLTEETFYAAVCVRDECGTGVMRSTPVEATATMDKRVHLRNHDATHTVRIVTYEARTHGFTPIPEDKPDTDELLEEAENE